MESVTLERRLCHGKIMWSKLCEYINRTMLKYIRLSLYKLFLNFFSCFILWNTRIINFGFWEKAEILPPNDKIWLQTLKEQYRLFKYLPLKSKENNKIHYTFQQSVSSKKDLRRKTRTGFVISIDSSITDY